MEIARMTSKFMKINQAVIVIASDDISFSKVSWMESCFVVELSEKVENLHSVWKTE